MADNSTFVTLSTIKPQKIRWLWKPFIPFSMFTILEGDPGLGKSFFSMFLASVISRGGKLPNGAKVTKGNVLYISAEDDPAYTTRPRIDAMRGDPDKIRVLNDRLAFDDDGLETLRKELDEFEPEAIFIDPWVSFVPTDTRIKDSNAIRALLDKIERVAKDNRCAVILIRHLTKMKHDNALYQGGGIVDMIAAARSAIRIGMHPDNPDHRVVAHLKHNVGPKGRSWVFELKPPTSEGGVPKLCFIREEDVTVEQMNASVGGDNVRPKDEAEEFLKRELRAGPRKAREMETRAKDEGISKRTLDRARSKIGVRAKQKRGRWFWSLPK